MQCSIVKISLKHKKICRNKLTLSSGTLMFRLKENFSVFRNFFEHWNFFIEDCKFLHCSALSNIFVQLSLDITFYAIECGMTTCPGYGESCHRWPSLIKWSIITIVSCLKKIRYCLIVARGSLKTLAYHSLPKYWIKKIQKSWNKMCDNLPRSSLFISIYSLDLCLKSLRSELHGFPYGFCSQFTISR